MMEEKKTQQDRSMDDLRKEFSRMLEEFRFVRVEEIPDIDLYMDQVLTFLNERLAAVSRDPENDKLLTKTMINNYAKNKLIIPPVNKKYSRDHMILLLLIFYMKSFLSIDDIHEVLQPLQERYTRAGRAAKEKADEEARKKAGKAGEEHKEAHAAAADMAKDENSSGPSSRTVDLQDIYRTLVEEMNGELKEIEEKSAVDFQKAETTFADLPTEDQKVLQKFDLVCRMSMEIYVRKLFIERLIDEER